MISATPLALTTATLEGAPAGLTITARLRDGDETLGTVITVTPKLDADGIALDAYEAVFICPAKLPVILQWLEGTMVVGSELVQAGWASTSGDGGVYFTVADLRGRFSELTEGEYPNMLVDHAIALAVEAFEKAADVAFVPRSETVTLTSGDAWRLDLPRQKVTAITSISGSLSGAVPVDGQIIGSAFINANPWLPTETLTVVLTHGYAAPPEEVRWAVMLLARAWLIRGPSDDRRTQLPTEGGGVINLATPGMFGAEFAIPDVDRVLKQYRRHSLVP